MSLFKPDVEKLLGSPELSPRLSIDFTSQSTLPMKHFRQEDMHSRMHAKGNSDMLRDGTIKKGKYAKGKRHAGWYDGDVNKVAFCESGNGLVLKGHVVDLPDPTRRGDWGKLRWEVPYLLSKTREWGGDDIGHIDSPDHEGFLIPLGTMRRTTADFSKMMIPGNRANSWGMPWRKADGKNWSISDAYNDNIDDGAELDDFEIDPANRDCIMMKYVAGTAGDTPTRNPWIREGKESNGMVNVTELFKDVPGWNLWEGVHTIDVIRDPRITLWLLDGRIANWDYRASTAIDHHIFAREVNSGVGHDDEEPPYKPHDPGLFRKANALENVDKVDEDRAVIKAFEVWDIPPVSDDVIDWCMSMDTSEAGKIAHGERNKVVEVPSKRVCPTCHQDWPST